MRPRYVLMVLLWVTTLACTPAGSRSDSDGDGDDTAAATDTGADDTGTETTGDETTVDTGEDPVDPPPCEGVMVGDQCVEPGGEGDNLQLIDTFNGNSFVEILDVEHVGDYIFMCAGTKGLAIYHAAGLNYIVHKGNLGSSAHNSFPRCQHIAFSTLPDNVGTGVVELFVTNRGDETQPMPWIKRIRFDKGISDVAENHSATLLPVVDTLPGEAATRSYEGVVWHNDVLYAAVHKSGVVAIDTSADKMNSLGTTDVGANAYDLGISGGGDLVVATLDKGLFVYDLTDPAAPALKGSVKGAAGLTRLAVDGDTAYAAGGAGGVEIFDVSDAAAPALLSTLDTPGTAMDVNVSDGLLAIANWTDLRIADVSDPVKPWLLAVETVPSANKFSRVLTADITGDMVYAGEWTALLSYQVDPANTPADIYLAQTELQFAADNASLGLIVVNEGLQTLEVSAATDEKYTVDPGSLTVEPGGKGLFEVKANGQPLQSQLKLTTNDPDEGKVKVLLGKSGSGSGIDVGSTIPSSWQVVDTATQQPKALVDMIKGKVAVLAYFATF